MAHQQVIVRSYGDTDFITGLRAVAATMVVIIHTGAFRDLGIIGQAITQAGSHGVDIFFIISGFTIAKTYAEARDYRSYLTRRLMRIMPLYWLIISVAMALWLSGVFAWPYWMKEYGTRPDLYNYLMHLSMLSFLDYKIANALLGVEWTIPIEVFWYVCMPLLIGLGRTWLRAVETIVFFLMLTGVLTYFSTEFLGTSRPVRLSPIAYGHLFFLGVVAWHLRARLASVTQKTAMMITSSALGIFILALAWDFPGPSDALALCSAALIVYASPAKVGWIIRPLTVRPMLFLGSISYSIYLIHILVDHILNHFAILPSSGVQGFAIVYAVTVALSTVTYVLVEKPTNDAGRRLVRAF